MWSSHPSKFPFSVIILYPLFFPGTLLFLNIPLSYNCKGFLALWPYADPSTSFMANVRRYESSPSRSRSRSGSRNRSRSLSVKRDRSKSRERPASNSPVKARSVSPVKSSRARSRSRSRSGSPDKAGSVSH